MHARQWFLLGVARLAIDYPEKIALHTRLLESIAFDDSYPHAGMREAARRALLSCAAPATDAVAKGRLKRLTELHTSNFTRSSSKEPRSGEFSWDRPKGMPEPDPPFHFDYDFDKYQLSNLARLFRLPRWQVADRCVKWVRTMDATVQAMHDFGGRPHPSSSYGYYQGTQDSFHSYGTYLARHALALAGGELFIERPVVGDSYDAHPWEDWLCSYSPTRQDGLWLADGTRAYPDFALHELLISNAEKASAPTSDARVLSALVGIGQDRKIAEHLLVNAW